MIWPDRFVATSDQRSRSFEPRRPCRRGFLVLLQGLGAAYGQAPNGAPLRGATRATKSHRFRSASKSTAAPFHFARRIRVGVGDWPAPALTRRAIAARWERLNGRRVMAHATALFDTAAFEEGLVEAGIDPKLAKAHRVQLALVVQSLTNNLATQEDLKLMQSDISAAIANASAQAHKDMAAVQRELREQTSRYLVWTISAVTLVTSLVGAFVKFG